MLAVVYTAVSITVTTKDVDTSTTMVRGASVYFTPRGTAASAMMTVGATMAETLRIGTYEMAGPIGSILWRQVKTNNPEVRDLYRRHYSYKLASRNRARKSNGRFTPPGKCLVLLGADGMSAFIWNHQKYRRDDQTGACCTLFRNEGQVRSSELIMDACELAWQEWGKDWRLYTFVDSRSIRSSNPGYCFIQAGWKRTGQITQKRKLHILEIYPTTDPE